MGRMEEVEMSPQIKISSRQSGYYGGGRKEEERRAFRGIKKRWFIRTELECTDKNALI